MTRDVIHTIPRLTLGISACLLGEPVRYNGGHKRNPYILEKLSPHFDFRPICPEMAIGLGTPRPPLRLVQDEAGLRVLGARDPTLDVTAALSAMGQRIASTAQDLSGYIFKARSPSCGIERVKIYDPGGKPARTGRGVYADAVLEALPLLPAEEEGRLQDAVLQENFIERIFAYRDWQDLLAAGATAEALVQFHTRHKLQLMAHGSEHLRILGRLIAQLADAPLAQTVDRYGIGFMRTLHYRATRKRHANVLCHAMGYLKKQLGAPDKTELTRAIEAYRVGHVPRIVPITLMRHYLRQHPHPYLIQQVYWDWAPPALGLWNET